MPLGGSVTNRLMKTIQAAALVLSVTAIAVAHAEKAGLKIDDIATNGDTSIVIKKGAPDTTLLPPDYEIVNGDDEITGDPDTDRKAAYASWKQACAEWRANMREMNKENPVITLNCNSPAMSKEEYNLVYKSKGTYKMKVRIRDRKK